MIQQLINDNGKHFFFSVKSRSNWPIASLEEPLNFCRFSGSIPRIAAKAQWGLHGDGYGNSADDDDDDDEDDDDDDGDCY